MRTKKKPLARKPRAAKKPNGVILYRGPSMLNGENIVVIATGITKKSRNPKTGKQIQIWILPLDIDPHTAAKNGRDEAVCGGCKRRPYLLHKWEGAAPRKKRCYVGTARAPLNVWKSFHRGLYPIATPEEVRELFRERDIRVGAYGDGAAMPFEVIDNALTFARSHTGFSHQWKTCDQRFAKYCSASVDNESEALQAHAMGWRTFRVSPVSLTLMSREVMCPASKEAGFKTTCIFCRACGGTSAKAKVNIAIAAH